MKNKNIDETIELLEVTMAIDNLNPKKKKNKRLKFAIMGIFLSLIIIFVGIISLYLTEKVFVEGKITSAKIKNYDEKNNTIDIEMKIKTKYYGEKDIYCKIISNDKKEIKVKVEKNKCKTILEKKDYNISLMYKDDEISNIEKLSKLTNPIIDIKLLEEKIYLTENETFLIKKDITSIIDTPQVKYYSEDENIAKVNKQGLITGLKNGKTNIVIEDLYKNKYNLEVNVTNLLQKAKIDNKKPFLKCNQYTEEQASLLDEVLAFRIKQAGKGTRAGAVAAARFLSLEFPYRIGYFLETGRLNNYYTINYVDGEGRYYHEGLYLSKSKFKDIKASFSGPAIWGCPLTEYDDENITVRSNGLDCSGFVTWALKNGGLDPGDIGAGGGYVKDTVESLSTIGEFKPITKDLLINKKIKAGDLASIWGHIAMIVGIDENHIYVAEEYYHSKGLTVITFTYDEFVYGDYFTHVVLMDDYYKEDGNYTNMW